MRSLRKLVKDHKAALSIAGMVGAMLVVLVGIIFFPFIQDQINSLTTANYSGDGANATLTGFTATLVQTVPIFYLLGIMFVAIGWALYGTKLLGD